MAIRDILKMGDPRLLRRAKPVEEFDTEALHTLVLDMQETMHAALGVGIAAPQIGEDLQVVIFGTGQPSVRYPQAPIIPKTVLINPVLQPLSDGLEDGWEGCLSVPGMRGLVPRYTHMKYSGFDLKGQYLEREVSGFHARVIQHECDHLLGILYPMRIKDMTQFGFAEVLFPELNPDTDD
jgi:peptide deformylase